MIRFVDEKVALDYDNFVQIIGNYDADSDQASNTFNEFAVKSKAVSYTHLDVYKRQSIRKQCYHYRIFSENGSHKYEFAGTEWLNPQGESCLLYTSRCV